MFVYIVIGVKENVYQDKIGGPFISHKNKELICGFKTEEECIEYIKNQRLNKPKKQRFGDTSYYKNGYLEMEYEIVEIKEK